MFSQKSQVTKPHGGGWFKWELKFFGSFLAFIFSFNFIFSDNTSALFVPTLSASVDNSAVSVNGNQVINSVNGTTELPLRVTVNTNNKTGYTATLNTETDETALVNAGSVSGAKIDSIDINKTLSNFSQNTWGFLSPSNVNYQPIPSLSNSTNLFSTATKTSGNESFDFKIGMKLADNLESGNYTNKLVISVISNPYEHRAIMTTGRDFNRKVDSIVTNLSNDDGWGNKESVNHILRSTAAFNNIPAGAIDVENDETSDYPIKIWYDATSKTVFYWTEANKIFLNRDSRYMFRGFTKAEDIDISNFDSSEVEDMAYFFYKMNNLQSLNLSSFNTDKTTDMTGMFAYVNSLKKLDLSNFNTSKATNMSVMFHSMSNLDELNISSFNTENVTNMSGMFYGASKLASLELSNFDTSRVTDMNQMFAGDVLIRTLDLSNFDTSNVVDMSAMFVGLTNLAHLNISSFNTSKVTNMAGMFMVNPKIEQLDLSHFDTRNVTSMASMFYDMPKLRSVNVRNFDTSKVEDMSHMFSHDDELTELDLSSFTTPKVKRFKAMFNSESPINNLRKIYVSHDWDTTAAKGSDVGAQDNIYIFRNRNNLVGGNGWRSPSPNNVGLEALRIDHPGAPGYFTLKP